MEGFCTNLTYTQNITKTVVLAQWTEWRISNQCPWFDSIEHNALRRLNSYLCTKGLSGTVMPGGLYPSPRASGP